MTPRLLFAVCLALVVAIPAAEAELINENLLVTVPDGYKSDFRDRNANTLIDEMVPVAQDIYNWTEMVTVQIFLGLGGVPPEKMKNDIERMWFGVCPGAESRPVAEGLENGYPAVMWRLTCPLNRSTGKPEITWFKAIQGHDSFYVVQKAFKFEPSPEQVTPWTAFLDQVSVCDSRLADRQCPATAVKR
jgi:hypothetical protein